MNQQRPAFTQLSMGVQDAPIQSESMMGSRMPVAIHGTRGLSLYRTFMDPERNFGRPTSNQGQISNQANDDDNEQDFDFY